jgi:hypothetical protein
VRKFIKLILISTLALVFTQCSVKPSKRTYSNAIGIWVGTADTDFLDDKVDKPQYWAVGINLKHLNPKKSGWDFFRPGTNTSLNVNSGIHFGKSYGMSVDASYHILTDDLEMMGGSAPFQFYIGPSLGADLISKMANRLGSIQNLELLAADWCCFPHMGNTLNRISRLMG